MTTEPSPTKTASSEPSTRPNHDQTAETMDVLMRAARAPRSQFRAILCGLKRGTLTIGLDKALPPKAQIEALADLRYVFFATDYQAVHPNTNRLTDHPFARRTTEEISELALIRLALLSEDAAKDAEETDPVARRNDPKDAPRTFLLTPRTPRHGGWTEQPTKRKDDSGTWTPGYQGPHARMNDILSNAAKLGLNLERSSKGQYVLTMLRLSGFQNASAPAS